MNPVPRLHRPLLLILLLLFVLVARTLAAADIPSPLHPEDAAGTITEAELEALPKNATFDDIRARLGNYQPTALSNPAVTFRLSTNERDEFIVFWHETTGNLMLIGKYPVGRPRGSVATFVWPQALQGKPMTAPLPGDP